MAIDSDEEWNRFAKVARHFPKGPAWVGAINESAPGVIGGGQWKWQGSDEMEVVSDFFEEGEMHDGEAFGAMDLSSGLQPDESGNYPKGGMISAPRFDWRVRGLIVERTPGYSSSYTFNSWASSEHPAMAGEDGERFYRTLDEGGSEVPLFSEGTGPEVRPKETDPAPESLRQGGQAGDGLDRLGIDRYRNGRNHVAFADGSVRSVLLNDLWKLHWHRDWQYSGSTPRLPGD